MELEKEKRDPLDTAADVGVEVVIKGALTLQSIFTRGRVLYERAADRAVKRWEEEQEHLRKE